MRGRLEKPSQLLQASARLNAFLLPPDTAPSPGRALRRRRCPTSPSSPPNSRRLHEACAARRRRMRRWPIRGRRFYARLDARGRRSTGSTRTTARCAALRRRARRRCCTSRVSSAGRRTASSPRRDSSIRRRQSRGARGEARHRGERSPCVKRTVPCLLLARAHLCPPRPPDPGGLSFDAALSPRPPRRRAAVEGWARRQGRRRRRRRRTSSWRSCASDECALDARAEARCGRGGRRKRPTRPRPDDHDYDEAETRDAFIDLLLQEAGWPLDQTARTGNSRSPGMPNNQGERLCRLRAVGR